jgi:hypothetical protein
MTSRSQYIDAVAVAAVGLANSGSGGHVVVQADIFFDKEEGTKECNKYLQACIISVHKNAYNDLEWFKPYNTPPLKP